MREFNTSFNDDIDDNIDFDTFKINKKEFVDGDFVDANMENETKGDDKMNKDMETASVKNVSYKLSKDILKIIALTISGVLLVLSVWIMFKSFTPAQKIDKLVLSYNVSNQVDYRIHLLENEFYETPSLSVGELVPVTFIDNIEVDFTSFLSATRQLDMNYTYRVTGVITASADDGSATGNGKIWTKNYEFVPAKTLNESVTTGYTVQEKVIVDYKRYNDLVNQYKLKAAIPMKAVLTLTLTVDANSVIDGTALTESNSVSVNIPLSVSTVAISSQNSGTESKTLIQTQEISANKNYVLLVISAIVFVASLISTILLLKSLRKMTEDHSLLIKFNKIMRDYSQVIIEIESLPNVSGLAVIEVKSFTDMLDVQKELHLPIMCCKSKEDIITDHMFYIINQNQVFKYRMNNENEKF